MRAIVSDEFFKPERKLTVDLSQIIERVAEMMRISIVSQHRTGSMTPVCRPPQRFGDIIDRAIRVRPHRV